MKDWLKLPIILIRGWLGVVKRVVLGVKNGNWSTFLMGSGNSFIVFFL